MHHKTIGTKGKKDHIRIAMKKPNIIKQAIKLYKKYFKGNKINIKMLCQKSWLYTYFRNSLKMHTNINVN